jgi:hypothetical protein
MSLRDVLPGCTAVRIDQTDADLLHECFEDWLPTFPRRSPSWP